MSALDAWEAWLMLTCVLLIACWAVAAIIERIALHRRQFDHARRCAAAREQMRREVRHTDLTVTTDAEGRNVLHRKPLPPSAA